MVELPVVAARRSSARLLLGLLRRRHGEAALHHHVAAIIPSTQMLLRQRHRHRRSFVPAERVRRARGGRRGRGGGGGRRGRHDRHHRPHDGLVVMVAYDSCAGERVVRHGRRWSLVGRGVEREGARGAAAVDGEGALGRVRGGGGRLLEQEAAVVPEEAARVHVYRHAVVRLVGRRKHEIDVGDPEVGIFVTGADGAHGRAGINRVENVNNVKQQA